MRPIDRCRLTFDDGPDPAWTPRILDALLREGAPSTFFVMADRARRQPALIERMRGEGHDVELHCVRHVRHTELSEAELRRDTAEGLRALAELGARPVRWRPPWGIVTRATERLAAEHDLELVLWSADTEDWTGDCAAVMHARVAADLRPDAVVLLHDGVGPGARRTGAQETLALLAPLLETMRGRGLRPATLSGSDA